MYELFGVIFSLSVDDPDSVELDICKVSYRTTLEMTQYIFLNQYRVMTN